MEFAEVIKAAGLDPKSYPTCAKIPINLYNGESFKKFQKVEGDSISFNTPLFSNGPKGYTKFCSICKLLESKLNSGDGPVHFMDVQITTDLVAINHTFFCSRLS